MPHFTIRRGLIGLIAVFLFFDAFAKSEDKQGETYANGQQASQYEQRGTDSTPLTVKLLNTGKSDTESTQESEQVNESIFLTKVLVGATLLQFLALIYQGWKLRDTVGEMKQSANLLQNAERAWIFGNPSVITNSSTGKQIHLFLKNFGKTPGIHRETYGQFQLAEPLGAVVLYDGGTTIKFDNAVENIPLTRGFPGLPAGVFDIPVSEPHYLFGYIKYVDIFRNTHTSRYCVKITPAENKCEPAGSSAYNDFD